MAYADIETNESSMASTIASSFQQISMSFGLAFGSLVTAWYLGPLAQSDRFAVTTALHHAFLTLGGLTIVSSLSFWTLRYLKLPNGRAITGQSHDYKRHGTTTLFAALDLKLIFYSWRRFAPCKLLILFVWMGVFVKV